MVSCLGGRWKRAAEVSAANSGKWKTVAEVPAPATTASVSLFSLDSESRYMFRVFAVNARGLGHSSPVSDSLLMAGNYCFRGC